MDEPVDPRFRQHGKAAHKRRRRAGFSKFVMWGVLPFSVISSLGLVLWAIWPSLSFNGYSFSEEEIAVAAVQADSLPERVTGFVAAFIDNPGDPMVIRLEETDQARTTRRLPAPLELEAARGQGGLVQVRDVMVSTEESFVTTLPSSQEDFAFFQALRTANTAPVAEVVVAEATDTGAEDDGGGWGDEIGTEDSVAVSFQETRIANTTSVAFVRPQDRRTPLVRDIFVRISVERSLSDLLLDRGFDERSAKAAEAEVKERMGIAALSPGTLVRMRGVPAGDKMRLVQIRLDDGETYFDTLAANSAGGFTLGSDPWYETELTDFTAARDAVAVEQNYRMLDAFYSTAIRNRVPSNVVGEAIALLSKSHDLDAFANPGDRMTLIYARDRGEDDTGAGQVLYVALQGDSVDIECFVHRTAPGEDYACYGATPQAGVGGAANGMVTPVNGVLTSRFGPRKHPILKTVRMHSGVDWAAPTGTPVVSAFAGTVSYAGDGGGYGNLVKITHPGGFETRYAHLNKFATASGRSVDAGEVIGYVGTTGRSTGPHLHFELRQAGAPLDPLSSGSMVASGGGRPAPAGSNDAAVETLVNQIIKVESAGNARAKNPLSTATGLGQFIESTWIRMMKTYRPDLVGSLSRAQLLELRFDPTISREMVRNLALEGESYLRARGHQITAGRLYLCHFLGAEGAHKVLRSPDPASLLEVLGAGVINANPFLKGKDVAYIKAWAERKMRGRGKGGVAITNAPPVIREPDGVPDYRKMIQALLAKA